MIKIPWTLKEFDNFAIKAHYFYNGILGNPGTPKLDLKARTAQIGQKTNEDDKVR